MISIKEITELKAEIAFIRKEINHLNAEIAKNQQLLLQHNIEVVSARFPDIKHGDLVDVTTDSAFNGHKETKRYFFDRYICAYGRTGEDTRHIQIRLICITKAGKPSKRDFVERNHYSIVSMKKVTE